MIYFFSNYSLTPQTPQKSIKLDLLDAFVHKNWMNLAKKSLSCQFVKVDDYSGLLGNLFEA